ncbi:DUF2585 family protein [Aureimonas populi]|uniref:DUF2585 family protein n=1 Tax=Aureimonas populi TaxID=1701758 RepID=A0ABW5CNG9_9HYPH|nr:DUF2585 family protein [Aureimonas populi]
MNSSSPFLTERTSLADTPAGRIAIAVAILAALVLWLLAAGRPAACPCGTVRLFVADAASPQTSQQVADWYSALHIVFGLALWLWLDTIRPHWPVGRRLLVAFASAAIWEAVENLPFIIAVFGNAPGAPPYAGDSILNAVADTLFVVLGFLIGRALPGWAMLTLALGLEALVWSMANDGYALGALRVLGLPV